MKTKLALLAIVLGLGMTSLVLSGERPRYVRGTGLAGLASPSCGVCADCCPACPAPRAYCPPRGPIGWGLPHHPWRLGLGCIGCDPGQSIQPGPPTAAITYPYYTLRGPRDFLQRDLSPIGP